MLEKEVPGTICKGGLIKYMAWNIYRIVNAMDIVEVFSSYMYPKKKRLQKQVVGHV